MTSKPSNTDEAINDEARRPRPVTPELRAQVKALAAEGLGRNAIARELEVAAGTVTKIAKAEGIEFDREATALAVRARQIDLADIRTELARKYLAIAVDTLDQIDGPVVTGQFGGRDNTWNEHLLDAPTFDMRKVLLQSAQLAHRSGLELLQADAAAGSTTAMSMVEGLRDTLDAGLKALQAQGLDLPDPTVTPDAAPQPESETTE